MSPRRSLWILSIGAAVSAACTDDGAATAREDAEPSAVPDAAKSAVDARSDYDSLTPWRMPDLGATPADAALPELRLADLSVVRDLGRLPDTTPVADAAAIPPDAPPFPVPCAPIPHVGDLPSTAQRLVRDEGPNPYGHEYSAGNYLACGDNWYSVTAPMSGDRACLTQNVSTATPPPRARLESFEGSDPTLACLEDADCAGAGVGFTCEGTLCMRSVGVLLNGYTLGGPQDPIRGYVSVSEIARGTTSATPLLFRVTLDAMPPAGDVSYSLDIHFASESYDCPDDWREDGGDDLPFIGRRGAICDRWLCPGEFADRFLTETVPDGVQAIVLVPRFPADALELRAGRTVVRVPGVERQCIVLRGVAQTSGGIITVARPHDMALELADYTLVYEQAQDGDPAALCASLGAPALAECPPRTLVAENCWPVVGVDDAQF